VAAPDPRRERVRPSTEARPVSAAADGSAMAQTLLLALGLCVVLLAAAPVAALQLPEDQAEALYFHYEGDGLTVNGPAVFVRKGVGQQVSLWADHVVDMVSGASIDVVATASEYTEERQQTTVGIDWMRGQNVLGFAVGQSTENDYEANTFRIGTSHSFFGDLTTVSLAYGYGSDTVLRSGDAEFQDELERHQYRVDVSQILTPWWLANVSVEAIAEEGFLNNPYRSVRYLDPASARGFTWAPERYPRTRTSRALAVRSLFYLPWRASLKAEGRIFDDSWGIRAWNAELALVQPWRSLEFEANVRIYEQTGADFYSDLFPFEDASNFLARDKELSTFSSWRAGVGVGWSLPPGWLPGTFDTSLHLDADLVRFTYDDFRNVTARSADGTPFAAGSEPEHAFDAVAVRAYVKVRF
jgi:hypothetical protein